MLARLGVRWYLATVLALLGVCGGWAVAQITARPGSAEPLVTAVNELYRVHDIAVDEQHGELFAAVSGDVAPAEGRAREARLFVGASPDAVRRIASPFQRPTPGFPMDVAVLDRHRCVSAVGARGPRVACQPRGEGARWFVLPSLESRYRVVGLRMVASRTRVFVMTIARDRADTLVLVRSAVPGDNRWTSLGRWMVLGRAAVAGLALSQARPVIVALKPFAPRVVSLRWSAAQTWRSTMSREGSVRASSVGFGPLVADPLALDADLLLGVSKRQSDGRFAFGMLDLRTGRSTLTRTVAGGDAQGGIYRVGARPLAVWRQDDAPTSSREPPQSTRLATRVLRRGGVWAFAPGAPRRVTASPFTFLHDVVVGADSASPRLLVPDTQGDRVFLRAVPLS